MKQVRLTTEDIGDLCLSLAHLYHAGISTGDALALMADDESVSVRKEMLASMSRSADDGETLSQVFRSAVCFPDYLCSLLDVGEQVGKTEDTLYALAGYYQGRARMERRIKSSLLYPSVLLVVLLAVVVILLVWVLPVFNDVYSQLGSSLTGLAGGLMILGTVLRKAMPVICVLLGLVVVFAVIMAVSPSARTSLISKWRKSRGDKGIHRQINTARFAQALSMGLSSGMTANEAADMASGLADGSEAFKARCKNCLERMDKGESLPSALRESGILSKGECRLLEAGIRSGSSETVMQQIAERLLEDSEHALEEKTARVEPTLVVVMSILVGAILLSVMLPLMHIMTTIG